MHIDILDFSAYALDSRARGLVVDMHGPEQKQAGGLDAG
jgi:hypothetical protein